MRYDWLENSLEDPGNKNLMVEEGSDSDEAPELTMDKFLKRMRDKLVSKLFGNILERILIFWKIILNLNILN